ncbi:MAG: HdeA/HdeB family chaperone [Sphingomonadales bacterium]
MTGLKTIGISILAAAALTAASPVRAQDTANDADSQSETIDISAALCRDMLLMSGLDRDVGIAFMHGYIVGQMGDTVIYPEKLTASVGAFLDTCLDDPNANALEKLKAAMDMQ